jgi:metal-responsive CopG/Arc/MetJ family transcriptional regulator
MTVKTFNLSLPQALVEALDKRAKSEYSSRSDYVRKAIVNQMRTEEALDDLFARTNAMGATQGIVSEQQVYDIIAEK